MDWKNEAADKLRVYKARKYSIERIRDEMLQLRTEAGSIRSARTDSIPMHGGGNAWEDRLINNIMRRQELKRAHVMAKSMVKQVDSALEALDEEERLVLERLYIDQSKGSLQRLCEELCIEQASVYRRRDNALRHFTIAMYGVTEM